MKILLMFFIFIQLNIIYGQVIVQYGDDIAIDCEFTSWENSRYYCLGDAQITETTYFNSNNRWERYYYKIPVPIILTEAPLDSVFFKIYKIDSPNPYNYQDVTLKVNRLTQDLSVTYENLLGNYEAPHHDIRIIDSSLSFTYDFEGWIKFDITELFNNWITGETDNYGIVISMLKEEYPTQQRVYFCQSLYSDNTKWPKLEAFANFLPDTIITSPGQTTGIINNGNTILKEYRISNYPNPFNPTTAILYELPESNFVNITVYNVIGEEVCSLVNNYEIAGAHKIIFNGNNLTSGIYYCTFRVGDYLEVHKMILLK